MTFSYNGEIIIDPPRSNFAPAFSHREWNYLVSRHRGARKNEESGMSLIVCSSSYMVLILGYTSELIDLVPFVAN